MKKKLMIIGILLVLSIPGWMWLYGFFGAKFGWFSGFALYDMNPISKHAAKMVLRSNLGL